MVGLRARRKPSYFVFLLLLLFPLIRFLFLRDHLVRSLEKGKLEEHRSLSVYLLSIKWNLEADREEREQLHKIKFNNGPHFYSLFFARDL